MGDIKLFRITEEGATELQGELAACERDLQLLIESRMETVLGIRFLAREHSTGRFHRGYIDSLGLDENNCPVIVEYKRRGNDNVINQALYYLDWLMDHHGDFTMLVKKRLGAECAGLVEFSGTRVICVASDFSRFDERAIMQIDRNVELIRYRYFPPDLLLLDLVNNATSRFFQEGSDRNEQPGDGANAISPMPLALQNRLQGMEPATEALYLELLAFAEDLGEDVSIKFLKHYIALSRLKNFACFQPHKAALKIWLDLDPATVELEEGFSRDVREIGHHGTGNLEIDLRSAEDLAKARPLIRLAYERN